MSFEQMEALVREHARGPQLGTLGSTRVNVLRLNLALDAAAPRQSSGQ